jgi:GNAT superfamily N-acetyltransferase
VVITPFDPAVAPDAECAAYASLVASARLDATPDGLRQPAAYVLNRLRNQGADNVTHLWTAGPPADPAGAAELTWRESPDNRDRAFLTVDVPPSRHSPDVVAAVVGAAAASSAAAGRPLLHVDTPAGSALDAWVAERGATLGSVEEHNVVRLRSVSHDDVAALAGDVPDGYELVAFDGLCPDELMEPFARVAATMNTAPLDDLTMEDWTYSPDTIRNWADGLARRGHTLWTVCARSLSTGELAGFNQVVVRPDYPEVVENEDTAVAVPHRGHGLGLWLKAVNLLRVLDEAPEASCIETWNAASNAHMLRVNRRLGFVCEHVWHSWELPAAAVLA